MFMLFSLQFPWSLKKLFLKRDKFSTHKELCSEKFIERSNSNVSNARSIRHETHHEKVLRKTFREESYLDKQVDRLTDAEWLAPPGLPASTTQTLYPRHSWSVSSPLPVIRDSLLSSSFAFVWFFFGFRLLLRCLRFPGLLTCLLEAPSCPMHRATYDETSSSSRSLLSHFLR